MWQYYSDNYVRQPMYQTEYRDSGSVDLLKPNENYAFIVRNLTIL